MGVLTKFGQNLEVDKCWTNYPRDSLESMPTSTLYKNWIKLDIDKMLTKIRQAILSLVIDKTWTKF